MILLSVSGRGPFFPILHYKLCIYYKQLILLLAVFTTSNIWLEVTVNYLRKCQCLQMVFEL